MIGIGLYLIVGALVSAGFAAVFRYTSRCSPTDRPETRIAKAQIRQAIAEQRYPVPVLCIGAGLAWPISVSYVVRARFR
jgi:hypothetical protein